jgi:hypothetical protein
MDDHFLQVTKVSTEPSAMSNAIAAALGRNKTYRDGVDEGARAQFRAALASRMRQESQAYAQPVSDDQHCAVIRGIADGLSRAFVPILVGERFRYGTAQKAFNLYLKFLWRLGQIPTPQHCPVDSIVLAKGRIDAAWTKSDSEAEYRRWIEMLRVKATPLSLAEWEYQVWLRNSDSSPTVVQVNNSDRRSMEPRGDIEIDGNMLKALNVLQERLIADRNISVKLPNMGENDGYLFTEVQGVTVLIGRNGGYKVPALRRYDNPSLEAAVNARVLWEKQKRRDDADSVKARALRTGHLSPIVHTDLRCGHPHCPCMVEGIVGRQRRSLG